MNVVHLAYAGLGGHGSVLFSLLEGGFLRKANHFIIFFGIEDVRPEYVDRCRRLNVRWYYVPVKSKWRYAEFVLKLYINLKKINPRVVLSHGVAPVPSLVLLKALGKVFVVIRDTQAIDLKTRRELYYLNLSHYMFDHIVYLTVDAQQRAAKKLFLYRARAESSVIGNGLDTDYFSSHQECGRAKSPRIKIIGMQSRLESNKDHITLIDAVGIVRKNFPEFDVRLKIAGDGSNRALLVEYVGNNSRKDYVEFLGMLDEPNLKMFLNELDVYVHSTYGETMSTALMQALSMGLPILASDVPGVNNMIGIDQNGILFRCGDHSDLADKLIKCLRSEEYRIRLSRNARQYAVSNLSVRNSVSLYQEIIKRISKV